MEKNNDYMQFDEQVERYLRRQMTVEEERAFKQSLADNPELKERARITALMIREMRNAVAEESSEDQKIIQAVKGMNEEQFRKAAGILPKAKVIRLWPRVMKYAVAACIVGIVAIIGVQQYDASQYKTIGNDPVYLAYTSMLGETGHDRSAGEAEAIPQQDDILALFGKIEQGTDVKTAVKQLQGFYDQILSEGAQYALAEYQDDFAWYLSIGYLKLGKGKKAIPLLEGIIQRGEPANAEQAKKLLERIKEV